MSNLLKITAPIPERIVQVPGGETFAVRGLSPLNVVALYQRHMGELEPMFQRLTAGVKSAGKLNPDDVQSLMLGLIGESPILLGELIAIATGGDPTNIAPVTITDPTTREPVTLPAFDAALMIAIALPFTVQIDALAKIGELTFSQDMPPGKFVALVLALVRQVTGAVQGLSASLPPAPNGSGESGATSTS